MNMFTLVIVCLVGAASAAKYCCTPQQWEADVGLVMGKLENGNASAITGGMQLSYDAVNRIVMYNQKLIANGYPVEQRIVSDFKNNMVYHITAKTCSKQSSTAEFLPFCIPDNATTDGTISTYGLGDETIQATGYMIDYVTFRVYMMVTSDTCIPIAEDVVGRFGNADVVENLVFGNITPGIKDRNVFSVPAQCNDPPTFDAANTLLGKRSSVF